MKYDRNTIFNNIEDIEEFNIDKPDRKSFIDHEGFEYNNLKVIKYAGLLQANVSSKLAYWFTQCYCGRVFLNKTSDIKDKRVSSCGCLRGKVNPRTRTIPEYTKQIEEANCNYKIIKLLDTKVDTKNIFECTVCRDVFESTYYNIVREKYFTCSCRKSLGKVSYQKKIYNTKEEALLDIDNTYDKTLPVCNNLKVLGFKSLCGKNNKEIEYICECQCGNYITALHRNLIRNKNFHCGCIKPERDLSEIFQEFLSKARKIHGDCYIYDIDSYVDSRTKTKIICKKHNEVFLQRPSAHIQGQGCPTCGAENARNNILKSKELVLSQLKGNLPTGSIIEDFEYTSTFQKIKVTCEKGHIFEKSINMCVSLKQDCPTCNKEAHRELYGNNFKVQATKLHEGFYDYSKSDYKNNHTKVTIICPVHGEFHQTPNSHLGGNGCIECSKGLLGRWTQNPEKETIFKNESNNLYILHLTGNVYKVGISKNVESRVSSINTESGLKFSLVKYFPMNTWDAIGIEKEIHKRLRIHKYVQDRKFGGHTELIELDFNILTLTIKDVMEDYENKQER